MASASAAANPNANRKLLTVSKLSLLPCRRSTFARMSPYLVLAVMPAGMVAKTKRRRNLAPKLDAGGVSCLVLTEEVEIYEVREETRLEELCFDTRESDAEGGAAGD